MSEISIEEALESYGLSQKEVRIYLACLELGTSTANEISNKADLNRSTTYDLLKSFLEKGIASKVVKGKTTNFEVASPERLVSLLEERKTKLKGVLPQLKLLQEQVTIKPQVELYEGGAGVRTILEDILLTKKPVDNLSTSKVFEALMYSFPPYIKKRKENKIFARVIQESSKATEELKKKDQEECRETRSIPNFQTDSLTMIYGEKFAVIKLVKNDLIGVLIHDKVLAESQRKIFEILWQKAK